MDRLEKLAEAYERARSIGAELLLALREATSEETLERIASLVERREAAIAEASALFQPDDREVFTGAIRGLIEQQQALEFELSRNMAALREVADLAGRSKASVRSARQLMGTSQRGRILNEKR